MDENVKELKDGEVLDLESEFIVLCIPEDTVEIEIRAKVYINHELTTVTRTMDFPEVRGAIREARNGYIPDDAIFFLAPTAKEKVMKLVKKYCSDEPEDDE